MNYPPRSYYTDLMNRFNGNPPRSAMTPSAMLYKIEECIMNYRPSVEELIEMVEEYEREEIDDPFGYLRGKKTQVEQERERRSEVGPSRVMSGGSGEPLGEKEESGDRRMKSKVVEPMEEQSSEEKDVE